MTQHPEPAERFLLPFLESWYYTHNAIAMSLIMILDLPSQIGTGKVLGLQGDMDCMSCWNWREDEI